MSAASSRLRIEDLPAEVLPLLRVVEAELSPGRPAWLVGGAIRDALMSRHSRDLDVALPAGALALGRAVADRLGCAFVALDERRGVGRVVAPSRIDVADFRGPDLVADLAGRDFTVNALAVPLRDLVRDGSAIVEDPLGGIADVHARRVRACGPGAFLDDPVRVMRAARLGEQPGWTLDPGTAALARAAAPALVTTSAERVRDELVQIVEGPAAGPGLRALDRLGALAILLPESAAMRATPQTAPHRFDVWEHSLRAVEAADAIVGNLGALPPWTGELSEHLAGDLGDGLTRSGLLRLAALLHDVAKPETRTEDGGRVRFLGHDKRGAERARAIAARLRLSRRAADVLARLVAHHLRPMHLAQAGGITRRARYRFFRDLGDEARDLLLLSLADASAVRGDSPHAVWTGAGGEVVRSLMAGMADEARAIRDAPLVTGTDVMEILGIGPGPLVGRHLRRLRQAQALGLIRTREAALARLRAHREGPPGEGGGSTGRV